MSKGLDEKERMKHEAAPIVEKNPCLVLDLKQLLRLGRIFYLAFAFLVAATHDALSSTEQSFDTANRFYESGKFSEALQAYEDLVKAGLDSPALFFNLGNAAFRSGQLGKSIAAFRESERRNPRDSDLRANLDFARRSFTDNTTPPPRKWLDWNRRLTLNEWSIVTSALMWIWVLVNIGFQFKPELKMKWGGFSKLTLVCLIFTAASSGLAYHISRPGTEGVIATTTAAVRYGPFSESQSNISLRDGCEVLVIDTKEDWIQIRDGANRTGWLPKEQIVLIGVPSSALPTKSVSPGP